MLVSVTAFKEWILESQGIFWRTQTFHFQVPPGTCSSCTARRAIVFCGFFLARSAGWCTRSLTRNSALLGFPARFCTQKQSKRFSWHSYWNLQMIFPTQINLGTLLFTHCTLLHPMYLLGHMIWRHFFSWAITSVTKYHCISFFNAASTGRAEFRLPGRDFKLLRFSRVYHAPSELHEICFAFCCVFYMWPNANPST